MRLAERVKIFTGADTEELEQEYSDWYDSVVTFRETVPALKGNPFKIFERSLTIRNYDGEETFGLAIFYEDVILEEHEIGKDKGRYLNNGISMVHGKKR